MKSQKTIRRVWRSVIFGCLLLCTGCGAKSKEKFALLDVSELPAASSEEGDLTTRLITEEKKEPYETVEIVDATLDEGERVVEQAGKPGKSEVTYLITYRGTKEVQRIAQRERILTLAISERVRVGTKKVRRAQGTEIEVAPPETTETLPHEAMEANETSHTGTSQTSSSGHSSAHSESSGVVSSEKPPEVIVPGDSSESSSESSSSSEESESSASESDISYSEPTTSDETAPEEDPGE